MAATQMAEKKVWRMVIAGMDAMLVLGGPDTFSMRWRER